VIPSDTPSVSRILHSLALIVALGVSSCLGPGKQSLTGQEEASASVSKPVRAWEMVREGQVLGVVVQFAELAGERRFYSVRNAQQQELGLVDELGRAWRYRAHITEPEWLGTGTVLDGVRSILSVGAEIQGFEVPIDTLRRESHRDSGR
jgi:hypothetical protein